MIIRNHSAERPACLNFSEPLVIPVDFEGSVVIMDEKGSLCEVSACLSSSKRHSVWLVIAVKAPSLVVHMAAMVRGAVIHWQAT